MSPREKELIEVVWHLIHVNTEDGAWHREWAKYSLRRATQGLHEPEGLAGRLHDAFDEHVGKEDDHVGG